MQDKTLAINDIMKGRLGRTRQQDTGVDKGTESTVTNNY